MLFRGKRNIHRVDYRILNSVGFGNQSSMSDSGEDSSTQSESGLISATGGVLEVDVHADDIFDSELSQLRNVVAEKEVERQRLIEAEKKKLRAQLNKITQEVEVLRAKKQKKGIKSKEEININTLKSDKKLKSKVASQLRKLSLKDDSSDSDEYDTACTDSSFSSDSDSDSESDYSHSSKKSRSAKKTKTQKVKRQEIWHKIKGLR